VLQSLLLLLSWATSGIVGSRILRIRPLRVMMLNIVVLALVVEMSSALRLDGEVTRNMGFLAVIVLVLTLMCGRLVPREQMTRNLLAESKRHQYYWVAVLAIPLIAFVCLRLVDTKSFSLWYAVDIDVFRGAEDNSKWLGAASALRVGESPGVSSIGGFLTVLLRSSLALADGLSLLGVKTLSSELSSVTFAVQFIRECLIVLCPFIFLNATGQSQLLRQRLVALGPVALLLVTSQSLAYEFGFLSFQVALLLGSLWVVMRFQDRPTSALSEANTLLIGSAFLLSWLPLRLMFPVFIAMSLLPGRGRARKSFGFFGVVVAALVSLDTFQYVFGFHPSGTNVQYATSLMRATGGVFEISQWLVLFTVALAVIALSMHSRKLSSLVVAVPLLSFAILVSQLDVVLVGGFGYGSKKLLFLALVLVSVWASIIIVEAGGNQHLYRFIPFVSTALLLFVVSSYGVGSSPWGTHVRNLLSPLQIDTDDFPAERAKKPALVLRDFGQIKSVLQAKGICTDASCDLRVVPRLCVSVYTTFRQAYMQPEFVMWEDLLSSDGMDEYFCTRFLTEISQGAAPKSDLQSGFFFAGGDRLRDSLTKLAEKSPETLVLVAREGKTSPEIMTARELRSLAWKVFPLVPSCGQWSNIVPMKTFCNR